MDAIYFPAQLIRELKLSGILKFDYEMLLEICYSKWIAPQDTVVDIGAHAGRHLSKFIDLAEQGHILGFEPLPDQFKKLREKFSHDSLCLYNIALCNSTGHSDFTYAKGSPEESGLKERLFNNPAATRPTRISVETAKLDDFIDQLQFLSFIKIDVEGAEIDVLKGAKNTLQKYRPLVSVEYGYGSYIAYGNDAFTLYDLAETLNYKLYDIFLNPLDSRDIWRASVDSIYYDFFMVPSEREGEFLEKVRPTDHTDKAFKVLRNGIPRELYPIAKLPSEFSAEKYLKLNRDVLDSGMPAEAHYLEYGFFEGRPYR